MTTWKFAVGLSVVLFILTLAVMSFVTPTHQTLAAKINDQTLKAAAAIKLTMR